MDQEINAKEQVKINMRKRLTSIKASQMKEINVQGGKPKTLEDRIIKYIDYSNEIDNLVDRLTDMKMQAMNEIELLDSGLDRALLTERYINNKDWDEVADCLGYEKRYTLKLHNDALRAFSNLDTKRHFKTPE